MQCKILFNVIQARLPINLFKDFGVLHNIIVKCSNQQTVLARAITDILKYKSNTKYSACIKFSQER